MERKTRSPVSKTKQRTKNRYAGFPRPRFPIAIEKGRIRRKTSHAKGYEVLSRSKHKVQGRRTETKSSRHFCRDCLGRTKNPFASTVIVLNQHLPKIGTVVRIDSVVRWWTHPSRNFDAAPLGSLLLSANLPLSSNWLHKRHPCTIRQSHTVFWSQRIYP
jgi:hypothetical protein